MIPGITAQAMPGVSLPGGLADVDAPAPNVAAAFWNLYPKTYTGNCLTIQRMSDNATLAIGFDENGNLDIAAIAAFCGAADGRIFGWNNQAGGADLWGERTTSRAKIYNGATGQMVRNANGHISWSPSDAAMITEGAVSSATYTIMCCFQTADTQFMVHSDGLSTSKYIGAAMSGASSAFVCYNGGAAMAGRHFKNGVEQAGIVTQGAMFTAFGNNVPHRYVGIANFTAGRGTLGIYQEPGNVWSMNSGFFAGYCLQYSAALTDQEIADIDAYLAGSLV